MPRLQEPEAGPWKANLLGVRILPACRTPDRLMAGAPRNRQRTELGTVGPSLINLDVGLQGAAGHVELVDVTAPSRLAEAYAHEGASDTHPVDLELAHRA